MAKAIYSHDLLCMNNMAEEYNYRVDLAYAREDNLLFGERIYKENARLWLYKDLAKVVWLAAKNCYSKHNLRFILYDGLRPVDAQKAMMHTRRAKENPHWMEEPLLLSMPGNGGHPRGMAIDIGLEDENDQLIDMGCPFDFMTENSYPEYNQAHRAYNAHSPTVYQNQNILNDAMSNAAKILKIGITPLAEEWWDFRLDKHFYEQFKPLSEADLPDEIKSMS
ncbi:MAG: D-Ala-D-Ala dipeptidase [Alphaproteobacteria bacterium]|nr:D-Ala-D-Ala dipeptidase [Alphaproteobacteria bacterium]